MGPASLPAPCCPRLFLPFKGRCRRIRQEHPVHRLAAVMPADHFLRRRRKARPHRDARHIGPGPLRHEAAWSVTAFPVVPFRPVLQPVGLCNLRPAKPRRRRSRQTVRLAPKRTSPSVWRFLRPYHQRKGDVCDILADCLPRPTLPKLSSALPRQGLPPLLPSRGFTAAGCAPLTAPSVRRPDFQGSPSSVFSNAATGIAATSIG